MSTKKSQQIVWAVEKSDSGWIGVAVSRRGLVRTAVFGKSRREAMRTLMCAGFSGEPDTVEKPESCRDYLSQLTDYFTGKRKDFTFLLDLRVHTAFTRRVLRAARKIPYGEVRSYRWVAKKAGCPRGARAVGQVMARNPLAPVVPCHRVIASDGSLGGFGGGLDLKKKMIEFEQAHTDKR